MSVIDLRDRFQNGNRGARGLATKRERMNMTPRRINPGPWIGIGLVLLPWVVGAAVSYLWCL